MECGGTHSKQTRWDQPTTKGSMRRFFAHFLTMVVCMMVWWSAYVHIGKAIWKDMIAVIWPNTPDVVSTRMPHRPLQPVWHPSRVCTGDADFWTETMCMVSHWFYHTMVGLRSHLFAQVNHLGPMGLYYSASANWGELSKLLLATVGTWHVIGRQTVVPCGRVMAKCGYLLFSYGVNQHRFWYDLLVDSISEGLEGMALVTDFLTVRHEL